MFTKARRSRVASASVILTLAVSAAVWAQTAPATAPAPAPGAAPTTAAAPRVPATRRAPVSSFTPSFTNMPVDAILNRLSDEFGFIIIKTQNIGNSITMVSREPLTPPQAIALLNAMLEPIGFAALETHTTAPYDRVILRVVRLDEAKKSQIPVYNGNDPKDIDTTDRLITQVIPLQTIDAVRLRNDLTPLLSSDADVTANGGSNSIIVTDTSAKIHRLVEIIGAMDRQQSITNDIQQRVLKYSVASDAANLINQVYNPQNTSVTGAGGAGGAGGFGGGAAGGFGGRGGGGFGAAAAPGAIPNGSTPGALDGAQRLGKVFASSDTRTNTVVVTGPPSMVADAMKLLDQLDSDPAPDTVFFIYNLKNAQSADIAPVLNSVFGSNSTSTLGGTTTGANRGTNGVSTNFGSSSSGLGGGGGGGGGARGGGGGRGGATGGGGGGGGRGGGSSSSSLGTNTRTLSQQTNRNTTANQGRGNTNSALSGQVYVVANTDTNSLLVSTSTQLQEAVKNVLAELDRPVPQVLIKVLVAEVTHSNADDIGFEFSFPNQGASGVTQTTSFGAAAATGGLKIGLVETQVSATLRALASQNKLDVLSRPYILAQDNQEATMTIGQQVPYITNSQVTNTGDTINSVAYNQVGILLDVIPHINPDGLVTLDIIQQVSQLDPGSGVPISSNVNAPVFDNRTAQSRVAIKNGETIVIGGMMQDQNQQTIQKVPILGDIPYVGMLFKRTQNTKSKTELLIFLTPNVAQSPDSLLNMSKEEQKSLKLVPNAVQAGTFQDQMKGMDAGTAATQPSGAIDLGVGGPRGGRRGGGARGAGQ